MNTTGKPKSAVSKQIEGHLPSWNTNHEVCQKALVPKMKYKNRSAEKPDNS